MSDLPESVWASPFSLAETASDRFKLKVVYSLAERVLLPSLEREVEHFETNLDPPKDWRDSNLAYAKRVFAISGRFYLDRLLNSVLNSIPFSRLRKTQRESEAERFLKLLRRVERVEGFTVHG